jgi:hypothetical protein
MTTQVFALEVDGVLEYWTGHREGGELERTPHRAQAMKFRSRGIALLVASTHPELRNSDAWKLQPLPPGCGRVE